jgi:hypothetical protein
VSITLADLARNPERAAQTHDGRIYTWVDGDLLEVHDLTGDPLARLTGVVRSYTLVPLDEEPATYACWCEPRKRVR